MIQGLQFLQELRILLVMFIGFLKLQDSIHQRFGHILPSMRTISSVTHVVHPFFLQLL